MEKVVRIGEMYDEYMLCQVAPAKGMWINTKSGNRKSDQTFDLDWTIVRGYHTVVHPEDFDAGNMGDENQKSDQVYITRYVRPRTSFGDIDNMQGVTFLIELDYAAKIIRFQYSICDGDNFDKKVGVDIAINRLFERGSYEIDMTDGKISRRGVVNDIMQAIYDTANKGTCAMPIRDAKKVLAMYRESIH